MDRRTFVRGLVVTGATAIGGCSSNSGGLVTTDLESSGPDASPGIAQLMKEGPLGDKTLGPADAPVTVIEYVSLTCPYSRKFQRETFSRLKTDYIDQGKVRFIVREFPIGRSAAAAAVVTRAAPEDKYFVLYEKFLLQQKDWTSQEVRPDAIYKIATQVGMTRPAFDAALKDRAINDGLVWVKQRGREFGVSGTPTFFVNGEKRRGALSFDEIKGLIDTHLQRDT